MTREVWANIADTDGVYQVSTLGRVRSVDRMVKSGSGTRLEKGRLYDPSLSKGYPHITLRRNGWQRSVPVHRLVAETFIPNPDGLPVIDHINGNKMDNRVENLEWVTHSENTRRAMAMGLFTPKFSDEACEQSCKARRRPVVRSDGKHFDSLVDAAREANDNASNIKRVCDGERKRSKGYSYEWIEGDDK